MKNLIQRGLLTASVCLLLTGCANWDSIYRNETIGPRSEGSEVMLVDAKQRAILSAKRPASPQKKVVTTSADGKTTTTEEYVQSYRAYCTEPSPDVFTVLSQAASASGSFGQDATSVNAAIAAAMSSAETGATIPRTQTINMLREVMYRTCERYMSGALDDLQFPIQAVRDQHMMVSILAIEQLTGAVTPPVVRLSSSSSGSAGQNTSDAMVRLDDAWKTLQTANADVATKKTALETLDKPADQGGIAGATCDDISTAAAKTPPAVAETDKPKAEKCATAKTSLADAKDVQGKAQEHYDTLKSMAGPGGTASVSSSGQTDVTNALADPNRTATVAAVADAVTKIVDRNFDQDEFTLFCIREMEGGTNDQSVRGKCITYMETRVENKTADIAADTARMRFDTDKFLAAVKENDDSDEALFEKFWPNVVSDNDPNMADPEKLKNFVTAYLDPNNKKSVWANRTHKQWKKKLNDMAGATSKSAVETYFKLLSSHIKQDLSE